MTGTRHSTREHCATQTDADGQVLAELTYRYDVFGNRIERTAWTAGQPEPTVERFADNADATLWADLNAQNQVTTRYLTGDAIDQLLAREDAQCHIAWYLTDRLGSIRDLVDGNGEPAHGLAPTPIATPKKPATARFSQHLRPQPLPAPPPPQFRAPCHRTRETGS